MIVDLVKLHIAEALNGVAENYGNEVYLNEVVTINFDIERAGGIIRY